MAERIDKAVRVASKYRIKEPPGHQHVNHLRISPKARAFMMQHWDMEYTGNLDAPACLSGDATWFHHCHGYGNIRMVNCPGCLNRLESMQALEVFLMLETG